MIHGSTRETLVPNDRAALYGDALFETLWWTGSHLALVHLHEQRLLCGAERLQMPVNESALRDFLNQIQIRLASTSLGIACVARVSLHRSVMSRGYAFRAQMEPLLVCAVSPAPEPSTEGVALGVSKVRLAQQPLLAGLKHANRLEQVLAAQELADRGYDDGLMCLDDGRVVCTTRANIYALVSGVWHTPALDQAGIAGTRRRWLFENAKTLGIDVQQGSVTLEQIQHADAVMISNAILGFQSVVSIEGCQINTSASIDAIQGAYVGALTEVGC